MRGGPIDYLMMDYLAEVTMSIMQKQKSRDPKAGYARDFVPLMERILPDVVAEGHPGHLERRRGESSRAAPRRCWTSPAASDSPARSGSVSSPATIFSAGWTT